MQVDRRSGLLGTLLLLGSPGGCGSTPPPPPPPDFEPILGGQLQKALEVGNAGRPCFGVTATAWVPGKGMWHGATGQDDIQAETPMPRDGIFRIGSITKTFVSTVFLQLETEGKVSLDDKLSRWVPDFPMADVLTMRQVMSHTSGIYNYSENLVFLNTAVSHPHKVWTPRELIAYAASEPFYFAPGSGFHYSNTDYILVGMAIESATGSTVAHEVRTRIFDKLSLRSAFFAGSEPEVTTPHLVRGYEDSGRDLTYFYDMSASWAAGAIALDADDTTRFMIALETGQLLEAGQLAKMRTILGGGYYGLGLYRIDSPLGTGWGHDGLVLGYWTKSMWFESNGMALSVMCDVFTLPNASPIKNTWDGILNVLAAQPTK